MKHVWKRNSYEVVVGNHEGKRLTQVEGNIKIGLKETGRGDAKRIYLPQGMTSSGLLSVSFSRTLLHGVCIGYLIYKIIHLHMGQCDQNSTGNHFYVCHFQE
jgi:hypothetical protein